MIIDGGRCVRIPTANGLRPSLRLRQSARHDKSRPYTISSMLGLATEAAAQHFLVAGKIVWAFDGLDFEAAIFAIFGASGLKDDHGADGVGPLGIRDVVAFDALRGGGQVERLLNLLQGELGLLAVAEPFDALLLQHFLSVLFDHLDQAQLLAAFGSGNSYRAFALLLEPGLQGGAIIGFGFDDNFRGNMR